MSATTPAPLKLVRKSESSGLPFSQTEAGGEAEFATKQDLKEMDMALRGHIAEMKYDLVKWIVGLSLAQIAMLIGIFIKLH